MLFISSQKFFSFSRYLSFSLDFLFMQQKSLMRKIRLRCPALSFTTCKASLKNKKRSPCLIFGIIFEENCFSWYILLIAQVSFSFVTYALVITWFRVQNDQYFSSFSYLLTYFLSLQASEMTAKYEKQGKYWPYCVR